jgi:hypothetical protein
VRTTTNNSLNGLANAGGRLGKGPNEHTQL